MQVVNQVVNPETKREDLLSSCQPPITDYDNPGSLPRTSLWVCLLFET